MNNDTRKIVDGTRGLLSNVNLKSTVSLIWHITKFVFQLTMIPLLLKRMGIFWDTTAPKRS
jgi:hypothetical protein